MRIVLTLLVLVSFASAQDGAWSPWSFVPADAKMVIGLDWQALKNSEFVAVVKQMMPSGKTSTTGNMDFVRRFDSALIAVSDVKRGPRGSANGLVIMRGSFDLAEIRRMAAKEGAAPQKYEGIELFNVTGQKPATLAILDAGTLLAGDRASVTAALRNRYRSVDTPLVAKARSLSQASGFWMIGDVPPEAAGAKANNLAAGARSFVLTANVRRNADLLLQLEAEDEQKAAGLGMMLQGLAGMAGLPGAQSQTSGTEVRLTMTIRPEDVKAKADQFMTAVKQQVAAAGFGDALDKPGARGAAPAAQPVRAPEPEVPPEKRVIKIYGLDEGVREIPMEKKP